ncbi:NAD-dependent dehydratase [Secundilactobacillus silagincola]|uniref:NAD-dependent dehydratase n=1 Tax=Secundilactobacillus silagincola TaxID=1714681 RepID=A0A1Z5J252_9LACO|nr:NAD(P)H-binding protein [Secundilactobacillus silagincola]GAX07882.1 NAD-dependent dehydratase [Secundilactobacillus silagincola]
MKLLILAANGRIAQLVEQRILNEDQFSDVEVTLFLRNPERLDDLASNPRVTLIDGSLDDAKAVNQAMAGQDMVFVAVVDHSNNNLWTQNVISAMNNNGVSRVISSNFLGIYNEVPGEFGKWNADFLVNDMAGAQRTDKLLADSGLDYTTIRIPWLNDRDEVKYTVTHKDEPYVGVSASRQSIADLVLKMVADPTYGNKDSLGLADPDTEGSTRPVY